MFAVIYWFFYIVLFPFCWFRFEHREKMPAGPAVVCANHTSWIDGVILFLMMGPKRCCIVFAKAELFDNKPLGAFLRYMGIIPVHRGKNDINAVRKGIEALNMGDKLLIFPQGRRVSDAHDTSAKGGAVMMAHKTSSPIVPVYITAGRKLFRLCRVICGDPFYPEGSHEESSKMIMDKIYETGNAV